MRYRMYRGAVLSALCLCLVALSGCYWSVQTVKIINESDFPLTSVRLIPYYENEEIQNVAIDLAKNLLPEDASGHTISLAPGVTTAGRFVRRPTRYIKAITFYVDNTYQVYMDDELLDLSCLPANTLLVLRVESGACDLPCAKIEVASE